MTTNNPKGQSEKGIIIIVAITILILLTILAMSMIGIGFVGKVTATNYIDKIQSEFLATSAIETAMTKILFTQNTTLVANMQTEWVFPGEDFNRNGILDPDEDLNNNGMLDTANIELLDTVLPSFPNPEVETIIFNNKIYVPSIIHTQFQGKNINSYTFIKTIDTSSLICINNIKNPGLKLILNNLAEYLNIDKKLGDILFDYLSYIEENITITYALLEKIWQISEKSIMNNLFSHLSLYCYEDKKVLSPNPSKTVIERIQHINKYEISSLEEMNETQYTFNTFAPVNINLAPTIIIKSTLKNISGISFESYRTPHIEVPDKIRKVSEINGDFLNIYFTNLYKPKTIGFVKKVSLSNEDVENIVEELNSIRSARLTVNDPFAYNWNEFNIFIGNLIAKKIVDEDKGSLIFANANPNFYSKKINPSFYKTHKVDRLDLVDYSTIYTFFPHGIFKIEAYNMFLDKNNQLITRNYKSAYVHLYQTIHETTIADFTKGTIENSNIPTINKKSLNIGPYPVTIYKDLSFPDFDGFLELSPLIHKNSSYVIYSNMEKGFGPLIISNLLKKNKKIEKALQIRYPQINKISIPNYSLLWDGVNYNLLNTTIKNHYLKIFETLFKAILESDYEENPVNMCFWFKLQIFGDLKQNVVPFFNIAGKLSQDSSPFFVSVFNLRKNINDMLLYNILNGYYNIFDSILEVSYAYFITKEITIPESKINTPYPYAPFLLCLAFTKDGMELYINGNYVQKQTDEIDTTDIDLKKFLGNIDIEKTISNVFFNGTIDYVIYLLDGKEKKEENERVIKNIFPQRFCLNCDKITYTTRSYQMYVLDKNCIVNLYWTDNVTATNLPDAYIVTDQFSLFEADILDDKGNILNKYSDDLISFDTSVGKNYNPIICSDRFKIRINFGTSGKDKKIIESPIIDDIYIFVLVPKYRQVLVNEPEKFK